ncbi:MAG: RNA polymerase sigma factor [Planctomycetes bacterium]|nr:RNA polymerase sigma factor [Planctomycetota bacterium]
MARLLLRIADGDHGAMEALFAQESLALFGFFARLCRCEHRAEDLVQSTFLSLWRYRRSFAATERPAAYLYSVALNQWRRTSGREAQDRGVVLRAIDGAARGAAEPVDGVEREEARDRVRRAIDALPAAQKEVFVLHRFEGLNCREIAAACGEPLKTIESRLRLALLKLTEKLRLQEDPR